MLYRESSAPQYFIRKMMLGMEMNASAPKDTPANTWDIPTTDQGGNDEVPLLSWLWKAAIPPAAAALQLMQKQT